ncbi:MAG: hypothetical protein WAV90_06045 [Gordonia amarae]
MSGLPDWAQNLPAHLRLGQVDGRPVVLCRIGVFWDSGCRLCQGRTSVDQSMPSHLPTSSCNSGGRNHCTCDACY